MNDKLGRRRRKKSLENVIRHTSNYRSNRRHRWSIAEATISPGRISSKGREGGTTGNGQERSQPANTSRGRRIFPATRVESIQSVDGYARNARNATRRSSGIWPGLLLSVRFAAHACKCIRVYRGSLRSPYHLLLLPLLAPPFELRRSSNRHAATVARENVLVSRYRIYHPLHFPPPVYILPKRTRNPRLIPLRTDRELERERTTFHMRLPLRLPFFYIISLCFVLYTVARTRPIRSSSWSKFCVERLS